MREFFITYLKQRKQLIGINALFFLIFGVTFKLYHLPMRAVFYPVLLCTVFGCIFHIFHFYKIWNKHKQLQKLEILPTNLEEMLPEPSTYEEEDYQKILLLLMEEQKKLESGKNQLYNDMIDYYTTWAHQIKTPIASMKLTLQNDDSELSRRLSGDLFRIEQYVEMVLMFLRLDSSSTDYVIKEYELDDMIKSAVRKFARQFIQRRIRLDYQPVDVRVLTDEKWFSFVIEQVLSNALKYTSEGSVAITVEDAKTLCIRDTGMGIAPEDLPRIFEKGYTGYNGRSDKKASGIGLYLCKRICNNLGHRISAESELDKGTTIKIDMEQLKIEIE
ncbi:MAG: sensor histidine kinase [Lachnospiraceae bacterium]|nr:sensor histidine kinase [Lachnospiraceae bacterium]